MTTKQYLQQAYWLDKRIRANRAEVQRLRELAMSILPVVLTGERIKTNRLADRMSEAIAKIVDLEDLINDEIVLYTATVNKIREQINAVDKDDIRTVLQKRYLNFDKWERIAVDMNYSYRWVIRLHKKALKYFSAKFEIGP